MKLLYSIFTSVPPKCTGRLGARIHPLRNTERGRIRYDSRIISATRGRFDPPLKKFFLLPFLERILRIAVTCSFVKEGGRGRERKEGREKRREKAGELERREEEGQEEGEMGVKERKRGVGGIVSPSGPQKSVVELEGLFVFN